MMPERTPRLRSARGLALAIVLTLATALPGPAPADEIASFYRDRRINLIVSYGPGGGYDVYGRILARHIGRHIPGHPKVVVQNMPGAGSLRGANYLYNVAPADGSTFGIFARNIPMIGLLKTGQKAQFDPLKFTWIGSSTSYANDAYLLVVRRDAKVASIEDARRPGGPPIVLGSTAEGASSDATAILLRDWLGFNVRVIPGYTDSSVLFLAIERGEVDGRTVGLSSLNATKPEWLRPGGLMRPLVAFGRATRHPDLPDVPTARELARNATDRNLIELIEIPYALSRPFAAPPGVPLDRARALQSAFLAAHRDPEFLADAGKLGIDISPIGGDQVRALIEGIARTPADQLRRIETLITAGGG
jgi:tripartite-type tricarboxylate transporter receptor subunit TctC